MTSDSTVELTEVSKLDSDENSPIAHSDLAKSVAVLKTLIQTVKQLYGHLVVLLDLRVLENQLHMLPKLRQKRLLDEQQNLVYTNWI